jgi:basic membrane lipoprotein Med (substrate-binding protein (PBP1-ABC) superfamily)
MRRTWLGRAALSAAAAAMLGGMLAACSSGGGPGSVPSRARSYADVDACLLTGPRGIFDPAAAAVWAGMEDVSVTGRVRASYLEVPDPVTAGSAESHLNSLIVEKCALILAVGGPEQAAVLAEASRFPSVRFVVLGAVGQVPPNVDDIAFTPSGARAAVARAVRAVAG